MDGINLEEFNLKDKKEEDNNISGEDK